MYYLENLGWRIKQIGNSLYNSRYDYEIMHRFHCPFGMILQRKTPREVAEYIETVFLSPCKFVGETIESQPRRAYAFKHMRDQEAFAKMWDASIVIYKVNDNWNVLI